MQKSRIAIIGAGKVGSTLAIALRNAGYEISAVLSLHQESADRLAQRVQSKFSNNLEYFKGIFDIVLITTPDREICNMARRLVEKNVVGEKQIVFHVCGAQSAEILSCIRATGANIGSMHPLQSFSSVERAIDKMAGTYFAVDGDQLAVSKAKELIAAIGGKWIHVPEGNRALYHAAACMASNYLVAIVHAATQTLDKIGIPEKDAIAALMPILNGTLENIQQEGTVQALTGPIVRGDVETVQIQLAQLDQISEDEAGIYRDLGHYTAMIAELRGTLAPKQKGKLMTVLEHNEKHNK